MSADELKSFHDDLDAAVRAGLSLEVGNEKYPARRIRLEQLESLKRQLAAGEQVPARYEAAVETWKTTGSMIPVLEGLSSKINAWHRIDRLFRKALLYLLAIAAIAIVGLVYFRFSLLPKIEAMRNDLMTIAGTIAIDEGTNSAFWTQAAVIGLAVLLLTLIIWLICGGAAKTGWWVGGRKYIRCRTLAVAARTMQMLVVGGLDQPAAASLSGTLTGLDATSHGELLFATKDLDRNAILSPAWADYLLMIADRQYLTARTWGPVTLIVTVGGLIALLYTALVYWPVVSLLYDLAAKVRV